jgi:hypothetical protein
VNLIDQRFIYLTLIVTAKLHQSLTSLQYYQFYICPCLLTLLLAFYGITFLNFASLKVKKKLGMVMYACNPSTWKEEAEGSQV